MGYEILNHRAFIIVKGEAFMGCCLIKVEDEVPETEIEFGRWRLLLMVFVVGKERKGELTLFGEYHVMEMV